MLGSWAAIAGGDFRGVYLNVDLQDGQFRQYAVLPLDLLGEASAEAPRAAPTPTPPVPAAISGADSTDTVTAVTAALPLTQDTVCALLEPLRASLDELGASVDVEQDLRFGRTG